MSADPGGAVRAVPSGRRTVHLLVDRGPLVDMTRGPALAAYARQLWQRRHFVHADARGRLVSDTRGQVLGTAWLVVRPLLDGAVYFVTFGLLLGTRRGIDDFLGYLLVGVFLFGFTARCLTAGSQSVAAGRNLVRAFRFPRASLPLAAVWREVLSLAPVLAALVVLVLVLPGDERVTWRWVLVPAVLALQVLFSAGLALLAARATARFPDLRNVVSYGVRLWFYVSGVFFAPDRFVAHPTVLAVMESNPMFLVLDATRDLMLYGVTPAVSVWARLVAWAVLTAAAGFVVFWRGERSYGAA